MFLCCSLPCFASNFPVVPFNGSPVVSLTPKRPSFRPALGTAKVLRCSVPSPNQGSAGRDEGAGPDGVIRDELEDAIRDVIRSSSSVEELRAGEERVIDGIVELGEGDLQKIGDALSEQLNSTGNDIADRIDSILEGELDVTLSQFERKRDELMQEALNQRDVIREEAERINVLATSLDRSSAASKEGQAIRGKQSALFAISGLFGIASLMYGWRGFVDESNAAMQSAAMDAVAAAAAAYFYNIGERTTSDEAARTKRDGESP